MKKLNSKIYDNGFKVIYAKDHSNPLVSIHLLVRMGSGWEKPEESGFSHFAEHLVFKATKNYPNGEIMQRVSFLGGNINAYTEYDSTCFFLTIPSQYMKEGLKILFDLVRYSQFDETDFNSEKQVVLEEISEIDNDPEEFFVESVINAYLPENPYRNSISGNNEAIENAEYRQLKDFIKKYYSADNCVLICSGDFEESEVENELKTFLYDWNTGSSPDKTPYKDGFYEEFKFQKMNHNSSSDLIAIAVPDLSESDPDSYALNIVYKELFSDSRSLLYKELFNRKQLIDGMRLHSITGINDGVSILIIFPRENVAPLDILRTVHDTFEEFMLNGISAQQLLRNQSELINAYKYSYEYIESLASCLGSEEICQGFESFQDYPEKIKNVTRLQVREMIDKWLRFDLIRIYYQGKKQISESEVKKIFYPAEKKRIKNDSKDYFSYKMSNGIEVFLKKISGKPVTGFTASFNVSQLNERKGYRGLNQITGELSLFGSADMSYEQINEFCALHGITIRSIQKPELTSFIGKCFQEDVSLAIQTFAGIIFKPGFSREYFNNLRDTHVSMIKRIKDYPGHYAADLFAKNFFGKNSLFLHKNGTRSDLNQLTLAQVKKWHHNYYLPQNMKLAIAGDFNIENTIKLIDKYFSVREKPANANIPDYTINPPLKRYNIKDTGSSQAVIFLGGFAPGFQNSDDKKAMLLLSLITGGDANSILFRILREKYGLAYSLDMNYHPNKEFGLFTISTIVERNNDKKAINIIKQILKDICDNGISQIELDKAKNHILGQLLQEQQSMSSVSQNLAFYMIMGWEYKHYLTRKERLLSVSIEDLNRVAQKVFLEENYYIQVLK